MNDKGWTNEMIEIINESVETVIKSHIDLFNAIYEELEKREREL